MTECIRCGNNLGYPGRSVCVVCGTFQGVRGATRMCGANTDAKGHTTTFHSKGCNRSCGIKDGA